MWLLVVRWLGGWVVGDWREDDSVKQIEKWIEMTKKGSAWEVDWIGARFMCRRGSNTTQWQKEFCP